MSVPGRSPRHSTGSSLLVGAAAGVAVLAVYLGAGLLVADWSVADVRTHLTLQTVGSLALTGGAAVATVAVPVALYLRTRLVAPLATLLLVAVSWFLYGALSGVLTEETVFGLALYLGYLAPALLAVCLLLGAGEYVARTRRA